MDSKKSIFEKLGLLEKVDNKNSTSDDTINSEKKNETSDNVVKSDADEMFRQIEDINESKDAETAADSINEEDTADLSVNETKKEEVKADLSYDKYLTAPEIYNRDNLTTDNSKMVYILSSFLKALPDNLPLEVKRQSVLNISSVSGINIDELINDGSTRLKNLDDYLMSFTNCTSNIVSENEKKIQELMKKIDEHKEIINQRQKLESEQKSTIEFEKERINAIIDFIKDKE